LQRIDPILSIGNRVHSAEKFLDLANPCFAIDLLGFRHRRQANLRLAVAVANDLLAAQARLDQAGQLGLRFSDIDVDCHDTNLG
jgi:hypothetical protein